MDTRWVCGLCGNDKGVRTRKQDLYNQLTTWKTYESVSSFSSGKVEGEVVTDVFCTGCGIMYAPESISEQWVPGN